MSEGQDVNEELRDFIALALGLAESEPKVFIACVTILSCACAMQAAELDATPFDDRCWQQYMHGISHGARGLIVGGLPLSAPLKDCQRALEALLEGFASLGDRHQRDLSAS